MVFIRWRHHCRLVPVAFASYRQARSINRVKTPVTGSSEIPCSSSRTGRQQSLRIIWRHHGQLFIQFTSSLGQCRIAAAKRDHPFAGSSFHDDLLAGRSARTSCEPSRKELCVAIKGLEHGQGLCSRCYAIEMNRRLACDVHKRRQAVSLGLLVRFLFRESRYAGVDEKNRCLSDEA